MSMTMGEEGDVDEDSMPILPPGMKWREQLLLNYCFGHANSSVLLFLYGHTNYVNHAPSSSLSSSDRHRNEDENRGGGGKKPVANVGLRWSEKLTQMDVDDDNDMAGGGNAIDPCTLTPSLLMEQSNPKGLVLEMFALTDIRPNDEILLDYGAICDRAWEDHVRRWHDGVPADGGGSGDYSPAYGMDDVVTTLCTAEEQVKFPYPDNVFTACFHRYARNEHDADHGSMDSGGICGTDESRQSGGGGAIIVAIGPPSRDGPRRPPRGTRHRNC